MGDAARRAQPGVALHGYLHQLVGVQAALHHSQGIAGAAHGHAQLGGFSFRFGVEDGVGGYIQAGFGGQRLHGGFVADECGLDEALNRGFDGSLQGYLREGPYDGG